MRRVPYRAASLCTIAAFITLAQFFVGCGESNETAPNPYCKVNNEYAGLFCALYERLITGSVIVNGDDQEDFGDSMAYCCALTFTLHKRGMADTNELAFALNLLYGYVRKVQLFSSYPLLIFCDEDLAMEVYIGVLGILAAYEATQDPEYLDVADTYFDTMLPLIDSFGPLIYYIEIPPYGPTTIKAGLAGALLYYTLAAQGTARAAERMNQGLLILDEMDVIVWDEELGGYRYLAQKEYSFEYMYSNVTAVQALVRAWRLTGEQAFLERADDVMEGLERIFSEKYGGYFASDESNPYAPHYGEEYIALSAQNYTIMGDLLLYQVTGNQKYYERALPRLFDFVSRVLWVPKERLCYHDIQHGQLADWYCTGCNWQLLYNLLLLDYVQAGIDILPPRP